MPFVFSYSNPGVTGEAGVLAGQAQAAWRNQATFLQQQQLARENDFRQQQMNLQQQQMQLEMQLRAAQLQQLGAYRTGTLDLRQQGLQDANNRADLASQTRLQVANTRSNDFMARLAQQNDQFLQNFGLNQQKLTALNSWRQNLLSHRAQAEKDRFAMESAKIDDAEQRYGQTAQTAQARMALTAQHYANMEQIARQEEAGRTGRANSMFTGQPYEPSPQMDHPSAVSTATPREMQVPPSSSPPYRGSDTLRNYAATSPNLSGTSPGAVQRAPAQQAPAATSRPSLTQPPSAPAVRTDAGPADLAAVRTSKPNASDIEISKELENLGFTTFQGLSLRNIRSASYIDQKMQHREELSEADLRALVKLWNGDLTGAKQALAGRGYNDAGVYVGFDSQ